MNREGRGEIDSDVYRGVEGGEGGKGREVKAGEGGERYKNGRRVERKEEEETRALWHRTPSDQVRWTYLESCSILFSSGRLVSLVAPVALTTTSGSLCWERDEGIQVGGVRILIHDGWPYACDIKVTSFPGLWNAILEAWE